MKAFTNRYRARILSGTILSLAAVAIGATPVAAQTSVPPADDDSAQAAVTAVPATEQEAIGDVIVTGSRIARSGFDASTPVNVIGQEQITLSGTQNVEVLLGDNPQFVASQEGGATSNTVPGGAANVNLRGFGATRNLVLVNGRRFAIYGPDQVTDLNTIPSALVERVEVVTGGSSAVYGSDAITGVVNFILRDDFEGVEARAQMSVDGPTGTPFYSGDLTMGANFADNRGNIVVSGNYLNRGSITRGQRGDFAYLSLNDGCVRPGTGSPDGAGVPFSPPAGQGCVQGGGELGFVAGGSGDIPNGRFSGLPTAAAANPALRAAYGAAGLGALGSRGFTFNDSGTAARPQITPQDDFNLGPDNYLIQPQERWMINTFGNYDFTDNVTGYMELHYSNNRVDAQLAPVNVGAPTLFNVNNPYLTPELQAVFRQLDLAETGPITVASGSATRVTTPGDGLAVITAGRRYSELGERQAEALRNVFRGAWGLRGELGNASDNFLTDLRYDAYYMYAQTEETTILRNAISRSRLQGALLSTNGAAPVCNIFGRNITPACADAISIGATNTTQTSLQVASGNVTGNLLRLPAGPLGFSLGAEWRRSSATFTPDSFLSSGDVAGFNPGLPTSGSISAREIFGEVRVPLIHDTFLIQNLTANGAFRYSDYDLDGVGGVWTYLGGLDWRVNDSLAFRGQYQRAIRAPNVAELFGGLTRIVGAATDPCSDRGPASDRTDAVRAVCVATGVPAALVFTGGVQPNNIIPADFGGNPNVGAEQSDTFTVGAVLTPSFIPRLSLSVDYFNITLDGAISALGGGLQNALNLCYVVLQDASSQYCQAVDRDPNSGAINDPFVAQVRNANTGSLKTSGIDFAGQYSIDAALFGEVTRFDLNSTYTYLDEFTSTPVADFPDIKNFCVGSFGPTCGQPLARWRGTSRLTWTIGDASISARHRYIGPVTTDRYLVPQRRGAANAPALTDFAYPRLDAQHYLDVSFTVDFDENKQLYGGVNNVLNNNPPITTQGPNANTWSATYDVIGPEFFLGAILKF